MSRRNGDGKRILLIAIIIAAIIGAVVVLGSIALGAREASDAGASHSSGASDAGAGDALYGIDPQVDAALSDYRNVLIFGLDNKHRSDIILLASINKQTDQVKILTVWRDTLMQLNDKEQYTIKSINKKMDFFKCNHAYCKGDMYVAIKEFNRHMDLNCRECIGLDWATITKLVDQVGGLEADVTPALIDRVNRRLDDTQKITHTGVQTLNGIQAIPYLRERKDATAVQRSERNQAAFMQVFGKINAMSDSDKMAVYDAIQPDIETNMSETAMIQVLEHLGTYDVEAVGGWPNDYEIMWDNMNAFYYYVPTNLKQNVVEVHDRLFGEKDYEVSGTVQSLSDKIEDLQENDLHTN